MDILRFPDPALLKPTEKVEVFEEELKVLLDAMWETMEANNGLGLAANQVGLNLRMLVMKGPHGRLNMVNPTIWAFSSNSANLKEGCLSSPGEFVVVPSRAEWIQVSYQDEDGAPKNALLRGLYAVCGAHEIDHLDGKSFMQDKSIPKYIRKGLQKKWGLR